MYTIDTISYVIQGFLIAGTALRVILTLIKIGLNPDQKEQLIPRIKNAIIFMVFGILIFQIKNLIVVYYK